MSLDVGAVFATAMAQAEAVRLLADTGDLLYELDHFWSQAHWWEIQRLRRLLGFPAVPHWTDRALDGNAISMALRFEMATFMRHLRSLDAGTAGLYRRAQARIDARYDPRREGCSRIWIAIYEDPHTSRVRRSMTCLHKYQAITGPKESR